MPGSTAGPPPNPPRPPPPPACHAAAWPPPAPRPPAPPSGSPRRFHWTRFSPASFVPGDLADHAAGDVGDGDLHVAGRRALQVVADGRARRRVLAAEVLAAARGDALRDVVAPRHRRPRCEQRDVGRRGLVGQLLERGDVVDDPDAPAVRADDQVVVARVHEDVVDAHRRQARHEPLPLPCRRRARRRSAYSVPRYSRLRFFGSSRTTLTLPVGRLPAIDVHVSP